MFENISTIDVLVGLALNSLATGIGLGLGMGISELIKLFIKKRHKKIIKIIKKR